MQELQFNNDQLFAELRSANNSNLELKVENGKLLDQIRRLQKKPHSPVKVKDTHFRECAEELCDLVQQFMHAMRQL